MAKTTSITSLTILACALLCSPVWSEDSDEKIAAADVPAVVMATMTKAANGATLEDFEKETEDGAVKFKAVFDGADGKEMEVEVSADGTLLEVEPEGDDKDEKKDEEKHSKKHEEEHDKK